MGSTTTVTPLGFGADDLAARFLIVWTESQPGSEVFDGAPLAHVGANFRQDDLHRGNIQPIDLHQINAS